MKGKEPSQEQEARIVQLGSRLREINHIKTQLKFEQKRLNKELLDLLNELEIVKLKRSGLTIQVLGTYKGVNVKYLETLPGFRKSKLYCELPCDSYILVSGKWNVQK